MLTYTGKKFYPYEPKMDQIDIQDIAHALAHICRFAGHVRRFYSVAEHSVHVSNIVLEKTKDPNLALYGLLHDASEAYLVDIPHPVKKGLKQYKELEESVMCLVRGKYGLNGLKYDEIKKADMISLVTEMRDLMNNYEQEKVFYPDVEPMTKKISPLPSAIAKHQFLGRYKILIQLVKGVGVRKIVTGKKNEDIPREKTDNS